MNFSLAVKAKSAAKRSRRQQFDIVRQSKEAGNKLQEEEDRVRQFYKANGLEWGQAPPRIQLAFEKFNTNVCRATNHSTAAVEVSGSNLVASPLQSKFGPGGVYAKAMERATQGDVLSEYRKGEDTNPTLADPAQAETTKRESTSASPLEQVFGGAEGVYARALANATKDVGVEKQGLEPSPLVEKFGGTGGIYGQALANATANNALVEYRKSDDTGATVHADDALVDTIKASAAPDSSETAIVVQQLVPQDPLWTVDLQHGQLTAETLGRFAPADGIVAHLDGRSATHVVVDGNQQVHTLVGKVRLGDMIHSDMLSAIRGLKDLKILAISRTQIAEVPVPLGLWPLLTELSLSNCRIEELPTSLGACESLRLLDVHENRLESLPSSTRLLQSLQRLWISGNNLVELPAEIFELVSLEEFIFHNNQISQLPAGLGALRKLQILGGDKNEIRALPPDIGKLHSLRTLSLCENKLVSLPKEFAQLHALEVLRLADNMLSQLHDDMHQHTKLWAIDIRGNQFRALPKELLQLKHLSALEIDRNPMEALCGAWVYEEDPALAAIEAEIDELNKIEAQQRLREANEKVEEKQRLAVQMF
eukprot:INCI15265.1.p1 GENE.INCI15265.1~~INCI15265.1.p1  ORF type:complete len:594 (+),score=125.20 INCI15265.1:117-1898(+)